jgi:hypothetical protein
VAWWCHTKSRSLGQHRFRGKVNSHFRVHERKEKQKWLYGKHVLLLYNPHEVLHVWSVEFLWTLQCVQTPIVNSALHMIPSFILTNLPNWDKYRVIKTFLRTSCLILFSLVWHPYDKIMSCIWPSTFINTFSFKGTSKCIWACQPSSMQEIILLTYTKHEVNQDFHNTWKKGYLFQKQYI